jgi:DNA-binding FadR family transcriptional regulator
MTSFDPINTRSLKEEFIRRFEGMILSGQISVGQKLPSERDLAKQLQVSRPIVHEGLLDLSAKGLVAMVPRRGAVVNDFRKQGSIELLLTLFTYNEGKLDRPLLESLLRMRLLFETEIARLAARNHSDIDSFEIKNILFEEKQDHSSRRFTEIDYRFHHQLALASGNLIYPLLMNSLKKLYTGLLYRFYKEPSVIPEVCSFHENLISAILERDEELAGSLMGDLLNYASAKLIEILDKEVKLDEGE